MAAPVFDHVNIVTRDLGRSLDFYTRGLGLVAVMDRMLEGRWFERLAGADGACARCVILDAPGGGCRIELLAFDAADGEHSSAVGDPTTLGLRHLALRVADLDARLATLRTAFGIDAQVVEVPRDIVKSGKRMAYLHDPDGVLVELCEYGEGGPVFC
ncbi:MAG: VOC family protein [Magnetospirillum sp.]|nr:VOC family protein [Magnetospirillum sp.]